MKPVYVCQLPREQQDEIRKMLKSIFLSDFTGDSSAFAKFHGLSIDEAIQNGMDSKVFDVDHLMVAYVQEYVKSSENQPYLFADATIIATILNEAIGRTIYPIVEDCNQAAGQDGCRGRHCCVRSLAAGKKHKGFDRTDRTVPFSRGQPCVIERIH